MTPFRNISTAPPNRIVVDISRQPSRNSTEWPAERPATKRFKRTLVMLAGGTVLILGIALIVLPGPAFIVIPAGLAILAMEFAWAKRWLRSLRAVFPRRTRDNPTMRKKLTLRSIRRSASFLFGQVYRTLLPKRKSLR